MPVYEYTALDDNGKTQTGVIEAETSFEGRRRLRSQRLFVTDMSAVREKSRLKTETRAGQAVEKGLKVAVRFLRPVRRADVVMVTRQFATLIQSGIPVVQALEALIEQVSPGPLQQALREVRERVSQGATLADALEAQERFFPPLYVNMVRAGEASGNLDDVLVRLADYMNKQNQLASKVKSALMYPSILIVFGTGVVIFLLTFVLPRITNILVSKGVELPLPTKILLGTSSFLTSYWWALVALVIAIVALYKWGYSTKRGRARIDRAKLDLPVVGDLLKKRSISQFAVTLSTLLKSGLPVVESLRIVRNVLGNVILVRTVEVLEQSIVDGTDIAGPLKESGVFPPVVSYMVAVGEETGQLEQVLDRISEVYDEEVDTASQRFTALLEPVLIIVMAFIVGFIVLSIMMPIMRQGGAF
jgi:general secretion pathway protein F